MILPFPSRRWILALCILPAFAFAQDAKEDAKAPAETSELTYTDGDGFRDCLLDDKPVWRLMTAYDDSTKERLHDTYKTFHHVFADDGKTFITKGAGGKFTHHRGLYCGWSRVKSASSGGDFWHCKGVSIRHVSAEDGTSVSHWIDKDGKALVKDTKAVTTTRLDDGTLQLDFKITLESQDGDIDLNGDPQHAGFQFRAHNDVTKTHATYIRPAGASDKGNDVWIDCPWCVNTFEQGDTKYSVTHMTHSDNPEFEKTVYSTRNYGRFGSYARATLTADEPLVYHYRILVATKAPTVEGTQAAYDAWVEE